MKLGNGMSHKCHEHLKVVLRYISEDNQGFCLSIDDDHEKKIHLISPTIMRTYNIMDMMAVIFT